jgi:hypothetical protein
MTAFLTRLWRFVFPPRLPREWDDGTPGGPIMPPHACPDPFAVPVREARLARQARRQVEAEDDRADS